MTSKSTPGEINNCENVDVHLARDIASIVEPTGIDTHSILQQDEQMCDDDPYEESLYPSIDETRLDNLETEKDKFEEEWGCQVVPDVSISSSSLEIEIQREIARIMRLLVDEPLPTLSYKKKHMSQEDVLAAALNQKGIVPIDVIGKQNLAERFLHIKFFTHLFLLQLPSILGWSIFAIISTNVFVI